MKCALKIASGILLAGSMVLGAEKAPPINWTAKDIGQTEVHVPAKQPSLIAFLRADQDQSRNALQAIKAALKEPVGVQVVLILSGPLAETHAKAIDAPAGAAVVADTDFTASGKMGIHVWPTTLLVDANGEQLAHLAGFSRSFSTELDAHLAFATGQIDAATLAQRLAARSVIADGPKERSARHAQVAEQLLLKGQTAAARTEVDEAVKLQPDEPVAKLALARVQMAEGKPADALLTLDTIPAAAIPAWRSAVVRLGALLALERWNDAKALVDDVTKLNPEPAEAFYLVGRLWHHEQDWQKAANAFKSAYESAMNGPTAKNP